MNQASEQARREYPAVPGDPVGNRYKEYVLQKAFDKGAKAALRVAAEELADYLKWGVESARERLCSMADQWGSPSSEQKPWLYAKEGDVWLITLPHGTYPAIYQADMFGDVGGRWYPGDVLSARRLWPEEAETEAG